MKALKITTVVLVFAFAGLVAYAAALYDNETRAVYDVKANTLYKQRAQILSILGRAGTIFDGSITLVLHTDIDGNSYYVGKINSELDPYLDDLADAYNADLETTKPITLEELRYCLTDGLTAATETRRHGSNFRHFVTWCKTPVDIVNSDGSIRSSDSTISHYIRYKDDVFADCYIVMRPRP